MWGSTLTREQDGTPEVDTHALQASLDAAIGSRACWVKRARVLVETESTQEAAFEEAQRGGPGVLVTCLRQPGGRGRLGRTWADPGGKGVAATLAITWPTHDAGSLSLRAGLAACFAARACLASAAVDREGAAGGPSLAQRRVERTSRGPGRKLAGVLIEQRAGVCLVGIGLNVLQGAQDWPVGLAGKAVSLHELGARVGVPGSRENSCCRLNWHSRCRERMCSGRGTSGMCLSAASTALSAAGCGIVGGCWRCGRWKGSRYSMRQERWWCCRRRRLRLCMKCPRRAGCVISSRAAVPCVAWRRGARRSW